MFDIKSCSTHSLLITDLLDILLEQSERQSLVELDLLGVPLGLELAVVGEDLVDDGEDVTSAFLVVSRRVNRLGRRPRLLEGENGLKATNNNAQLEEIVANFRLTFLLCGQLEL